MTDKVKKILSEIATRKLCTMDEHMSFYNDAAKEDYRFLSDIEELIKALQKEPVSEKKCMFTKDSYTDEDRKILCDGCKEKCEYNKKEEPVSEDLEEAAKRYALNNTPWDDCVNEMQESFKAGAQWQKANLWKDAQGDDLPEIDREVIALLDNGKVVFAHRPLEFLDGKDIVTSKVTRNYPKTYDKGGWNIPNVKWWLDCSFPNMEEG